MFEDVSERSIFEAVKKTVRNCAKGWQPREFPSFPGPKSQGPFAGAFQGADAGKPFRRNRSNASPACC
jgi:hypothetical protein